MRKIGFIFCFLLATTIAYAQDTRPLADSAFVRYLKLELPQVIQSPNKLILSQAALVTSVNCSNLQITSLEGIQYFAGLTSLNASNNDLKNLPDLSALARLEILNVNRNELSEVPDFSGLLNLQVLDLSDNRLKVLLQLSNPNLLTLDISDNRLTKLADLNDLKALKLLDASDNILAELPALTSLNELEYLNCHGNQLLQMPNLSKLSQLRYLNVEGNRLTQLPEFGLTSVLAEVDFDYNFLTDVAGLLTLPALTRARVEFNYLTYTDFIILKGHIKGLDIFSFRNQRYFGGGSYNVYEGQPVLLQTNIDAGLDKISYEWILNSRSIKVINNDSLIVTPSGSQEELRYYCWVRHADFSGMILRTYYYTLKVQPCTSVPSLSPNIISSNCLKGGEVRIDTTVFPASRYRYTIKGKIDGKVSSSTDGTFLNLNQREYTLTVSSRYCPQQSTQEISIPSEECREALLTPNGDEDHDELYFPQAGTITIFDKGGKRLTAFQAPGTWKGLDAHGRAVPVGYYIAEVNNGQDFLMITVAY